MSIPPTSDQPFGTHVAATPGAHSAEEASVKPRWRPRSVLIVDDEAGMRMMAKAILESVGYQIEAAESGEEAIEKYRARLVGGRPFGLVVMDLALPGGISGVEALGALRAIDPEVRVVASSGYLESNAREAALRTGFAGILPKPYTADRLASVVRHSIDALTPSAGAG